MTKTQNRLVGVRSVAPRVRGQAKVRKFPKNCSNNPSETVNCTDDNIRDDLNRRLGDSNIQQDMGKNDQDMTLEDTIKYIEIEEAAKRSQATLQNPECCDSILV